MTSSVRTDLSLGAFSRAARHLRERRRRTATSREALGHLGAIGDKPLAFQTVAQTTRDAVVAKGLRWLRHVRPRPSGHQQTVRVPFGRPSVAILSANV